MTADEVDAARLEAAIACVEQAGDLNTSGLAYGIGEHLAGEWNRIGPQIDELLGRLTRTIANYAWVETSAGLTVVGYKGDVRTAIAPELTSGQFETHMRSLALALDYKARLTRLLVASLRTLTAILSAVAFPLSVGAAIQASWRLIAELRGILEPLG